MNGPRSFTASTATPPASTDLFRHTRLVDQSSSSGTAGINTDYTTEDTKSTSIVMGVGGRDFSMTAAGVASVAQAAVAASKSERSKPKMAYEVRPFTKESLEKINLRTSNLIRDYGFLPKRKPNLMDGAELPAKYEPFPPELIGKPVEEIDQYVYEKTFCVVSRRFQKHYVQRFSATRSLFIFAPWNKFRCLNVFLCTNQYFDYVVMLTILVNCIFLAMPENIEEAEFIFLGIYSLEMVIRVVAKGFILNNYTYLRSPWNWLDFLVIFSGYLTSFIEMGNLAGLRTFRVLRALKTISILPSLKTIINALLNAVKQLAEVMTLTIFCLMVFALFALQVYMGQLRNKCVAEWPGPQSGIRNWTEWVMDEDHWFMNGDQALLCGNVSGARPCPSGYVCLPHVGDNPNYGFTSFDNLLWSMLTTFQLITLDYWENVYNMVVATGGPMHVIFFTIVVFFGSFYLINLMLAVVAMSYEDEAEANNKEKEKEANEAKEHIKPPSGDECTIRTNPPRAKDADGNYTGCISRGGSISDGCETCSHKATSREALHKMTEGSLHEKNGRRNVVMKARQEGSEIRGYDISDSAMDPTFLKNCDSYEARLKSLGRSVSGEDEVSNLDSVSEQARLKNQQLESEGIINCQGQVSSGKRPSKIDIPCVVSIEEGQENIEEASEGNGDRNCLCCKKCCCCYGTLLTFQNFLLRVTTDMLFESAVTVCIILNTAFLAVEHHGMSDDLKHVLEIGNKVFTIFFTTEAVLKLMALSKEYFDSGWNVFDLVIVAASLVDLGVEDINGISVLRGMRLMRVLKLAQSWTTMKVLLSIIISTLGALGNLTFLLIIVIYIFAVLGMQLFGKTYTDENFYPDRVPRWNFTDFFHSFMMIFRILCGEWIEPLWDCMRAEGKVGVAESCLTIFLPALVVGNFMVLNLFLALLLNSFNCEELKSRKELIEGEVRGEATSIVTKKLNKLKEIVSSKKKKALEVTAGKFVSNGSLLSQNGLKNENGGGPTNPELQNKIGDDSSAAISVNGYEDRLNTSNTGGQKAILAISEDNESAVIKYRSDQDMSSIGPSKSLTFEEGCVGNGEAGAGTESEAPKKVPDPCCPIFCERMFSCCSFLGGTCLGKSWTWTRQFVHNVVDNPFFEWTILLLIFASSLSLCFEDINLQDNEELMFILKIVNMVFAVLFFLEMILKWIAFGLWRYFTSAWTCLDFVIVCVSILSLAIEGSANLTALRSLRTLRALRPLRAISRWQGMKIVVNALMYAIPSIINVLLVCLVFWLIFSIMGVQFFGGKFYKCTDAEGERLPIDIINDKFECFENNYTWVNSKIHFDHVGHAYLALFQVATFEGWMEVMADAVDCREIDEQPEYEASKYNYFYFVIFIVCGSFFTLNLFIGVIIDNFNALKKKYEGGVLEMFLTESQKNYYTAMKKLGRKKPQKVIRRPTNEIHALFYDISLSRRFEIAIFVLIFLNMVSMGIEHYNQARVVTFTLEICNALFTTIFSLECLVKIIGLRYQYFTAGWNIFDFVLVIASIVGIVMEDMMEDFPVSPTLLRVARVCRIGRILRLIKAAKGIRKLLFALIVSLPALFNIGALLALITFIYAIIGMTLFGHVKHRGALNDQVNFETFGRSMQLLFRLTTSAGWNDVLEPLLVTPPYCDPHYRDLPNGNCGHPFVAIIYFVSFIIINYMIVINMYIAIILENFNQAHQEEEIGIVEEDLEMFYTKWAKYDPHATQFINFSQLSDFIASLDAPLGIPKPNILALVSFDLPIAKGDKIHCLDVLHSLTKYTLGFVDDGDEDFGKGSEANQRVISIREKSLPEEIHEEFKGLAAQMDEKFKKQFPTRKELEIVSSTREWKRLDNAARIIQRFFKIYVAGVDIEERIDIHTQTRGKTHSANPYLTGNKLDHEAEMEAESVQETMEDEEEMEYNKHGDLVDTEWKTQSLPSLGRVSSEQTLESSGDEFAALRRAAPTRMLKSRNIKYKTTDEETFEEDVADNQAEVVGHYEEPEDMTVASEPPYNEKASQPLKRPIERDVERGAGNYMMQEPEEIIAQQQQQRRPQAQGRTSSRNFQDRYSYAGYEPEREFKDYAREREMMMRRSRQPVMPDPMLPHSAPRMLPPRPLDQHQVQGPPMPPPVITPSSGGRRKLPNIPRSAKLPHRPHVPHEPHYPSSFHSSFDEDMAPSMGSNLPPTVYESYHQQYRQLQRQQSSPMGSNRQLPMAPFGHRRTASSSSFTQPDEMDHRGSLPRNQGQRYSYHENPAHRYEHDHFSSLPRDHRFLSWKRDLRPPGGQQAGRRAGQGASAVTEIESHHRRSFHYDDRKEFAPQYAAMQRGAGQRGGGGSAIKRDLSPARRSFDPSIYETCDRPNYEEPQNTGAKSHDTYEPQVVQALPPKTPEKLLTPGSPMESLRRRHMSQFRGGGGASSGVVGPQEIQQPFRNTAEPQAFMSGNRSVVQTQPAYRPSKEPSQSPLVAVPIIETHVGMKPRTSAVHPLEYPVSADAYPDPEFYVREAQREVVEEAKAEYNPAAYGMNPKAEYNPAAYGMNRAEEQLIAYPVQERCPEQRRISPSREYTRRWSGLHESEIATDPDWIRERDARLEREIREKEQILDREIREREIRESEQHYEEVTAKRNSRLRAQMSYETGYETQLTPEESEQLRYVVTGDENEEIETSQDTGTKTKTVSSGSGTAKKRSPRSPRKSQRTSPDTEKPVKKEKRSKKNRSNVESESEKTGGGKSAGNGKKPVHRHDSSRKSIRRQAKVESSKNTGESGHNPAETGGGAISGADLSDVFDEEYYEQDTEMNFQDRSNCRKK